RWIDGGSTYRGLRTIRTVPHDRRPRGEGRVMDADVVIVGAGPVGLMLAGELCLVGVRPLVLERQPRVRGTPKASGFNGQIVELLRDRGLLDRIEAASGRPAVP